MATLTIDPGVVREIAARLGSLATLMSDQVNQISSITSSLYAAVEGEQVGALNRLQQVKNQLYNAPSVLQEAQAGLNALATDAEKAEADAMRGAAGLPGGSSYVSTKPPSLSNLPPGVTKQEYQDIVNTYPDKRTQQLLLLMMSTPTGRSSAEYLLYMGKQAGSDFISWQGQGNNVGATTTNGGYIHMNPDVFTSNDQNSVAENASYLLHESMESYFDVAQGRRSDGSSPLPMGSQHADYLAEWFQGKFLQELPANQYSGGDTHAYGQTFSNWITNGGTGYNHEPVNSDLSQQNYAGYAWNNGTGVDWWDAFWGTQVNSKDIPNPMGVQANMLAAPDMRPIDPFNPDK